MNPATANPLIKREQVEPDEERRVDERAAGGAPAPPLAERGVEATIVPAQSGIHALPPYIGHPVSLWQQVHDARARLAHPPARKSAP